MDVAIRSNAPLLGHGQFIVMVQNRETESVRMLYVSNRYELRSTRQLMIDLHGLRWLDCVLGTSRIAFMQIVEYWQNDELGDQKCHGAQF